MRGLSPLSLAVMLVSASSASARTLRGRRLDEVELVPADEAAELEALEARQRAAAEAALQAEQELAAKKAAAKAKKEALRAEEEEAAAALAKKAAEEAEAAAEASHEAGEAQSAELEEALPAPAEAATTVEVAEEEDKDESGAAASSSSEETSRLVQEADQDETAKLASLSKEAEALVTQLQQALEEEAALLASLNEKLALIKGGEDRGVSTASADSLTAVTWNMAAINNNPFEYWITYEGEGGADYERLMEQVGAFIAAPGERDVRVDSVFTEKMFEELSGKMIVAGFTGVADVANVWREDFSQRKIVSEVLKDAALGAKRLMSMPDRVTNTMQLSDGTTATRPTVINCFRGADLSSTELWWPAWKDFMFDTKLATPKSPDSPKAPAKMLAPITNAKYPAVTLEEERISVPLSTLSLAIFDAILIHVMNSVDETHEAWQKLRSEMCHALNDKKNERSADLLESQLYKDADVIFVQESSRAFANYGKDRDLGASLFDFAELPGADTTRDQNSLILLKKNEWSDVTDLSAEVMTKISDNAAAQEKKSPVAPGDLAVFRAARKGKTYLLASFHGDTNGLATAPVLEALHQYHEAEQPETALLFGLDANVHAHAAKGKANVEDFAALFTSLDMTSCYGSSPDPEGFTTFNARTYLQPQLNKAVKAADKFTSPLVDRNPKDFVLYYAKDFDLATVAKDNTGTGVYNNDIVFPTLAFPSDHAITKTTLKPKF